MSTRAPQIDNNFAISPTSLNTWYLICLVTSWRVRETPFWCNFFNIERKKIIVKPTQWSRGYKMASGQRKGLKGVQRTRRVYFFRECYYWVNWVFHQLPNNISFTQPSTQKRQKKEGKRWHSPHPRGTHPPTFFTVAFYDIPLNIFISLHPCLHYVQICPFLVKNNPWAAFYNDICL